MSLLQELIKETAAAGATGAGAIGAAPGSLFGGGMVSRNKKRRMTKVDRIPVGSLKKIKNRNAWKWRIIGEMVDDEAFDAADVESKLKSAEKKSKVGEDSVPFGLEDEDGNIVKVFVRSEQADEFESALATMLAGEDEDEDEQTSSVEIAEVLFRLKDQFDIVDVEWHEIEGDVEEEQEVEGEMPEGERGGGEGEMPPGEEIPGDEEGAEGEDLEGMEDLEGEGEMEPEGGAEGALSQVIDMMKADAEARKAESEARAKEAEARAAEAHANSAASKVKQEEEVLDMEAFNKQKKEEEEEAKRLASLAKWKHDQTSAAEVKAAEEEEERITNDPRSISDISTITKDELMLKILKYLRAN